MSSFDEAFGHVAPATDAAEAGVRERHPDVFAAEEAPPPAEELEPHEFRYDHDGTQHRQLGARERATLNEGHLSAHGRQAVMARLEQQLEGANDATSTATATRTTATTTTATATRTTATATNASPSRLVQY